MLLRLLFFFFNDTATTEIYTLSLHDALPISLRRRGVLGVAAVLAVAVLAWGIGRRVRAGGSLSPIRSIAILPLLNLSNDPRSEEHTSELQSQSNLVCRLLLEKKKIRNPLPRL